ncbi:DNA topoisomerase 3 [Bengtsoniella intestinalis]|uniref:DNA topoisomerase 3 n=1 Tax=Bengtsoniella intestinalis TaxID=3073143 RepID=UPI00391F1E1D
MTTHKLVIAEKPSVAQSIAHVLGANRRNDGYLEGKGYIVSWCVGHLVELASAEVYDPKYAKWSKETLPIIPSHWQYQTNSSTQKQFSVLKKLMADKKVDTIICATDAGREGELIFRLVYNQAGCTKPVKRLWISSMEESAIADGFANLHDGSDFDNLYQAALARAQADWLVGINATRLFSSIYGLTLNIGRVVSPTLAMIVEREATIKAFVPQPFYTVQLDCDGLVLAGDKLEAKNQAEGIASVMNGKNLVISTVETKEKSEKPPKLYDLTTLQREANKLLGFTAEQTLTYTQSLYEKKLVTYPRTDSRYLTEDMKSTIPAVASAVAGLFDGKNHPIHMEQVVDNSKVSDHHAIIPTMKAKGLDVQSLPFGERETLLLIAIRLLVAVGEVHRYGETIITAQHEGHNFTAKGKTVLQSGWKEVQALYKETKTKGESPLPTVVEGQVFTPSATVKEGKTTSPKHYTDDTLLASMENANNALDEGERKGIGTPATRAGILEKLVKTGLAQRKGDKKAKHFIATDKGNGLITVLPEAIQSPELTAEWETQLKQVEQGELSPSTFLEGICSTVKTLVDTYEPVEGAATIFPSDREVVGTCPRCGGTVTENKKGFCCATEGCGFALWKANRFFTAKKKSLTPKLAKELLANGKVKLTGCYSEKTGRNYDCTVMMEDKGEGFVNFKMVFENKKKAPNKRK